MYEQLIKIKEKHNNVMTHNLAPVSDFVGKSAFYVDDKRLSNSSFQNLVEESKDRSRNCHNR